MNKKLISLDGMSLKEVFQKGDLATKLSFLIMGLANLKNKQIVKGLLFLISEILFLITFVYQVIPAVKGLISLGTQEQGMTTKTVDGIKIQVATQGDKLYVNANFWISFAYLLLRICLYLLVKH